MYIKMGIERDVEQVEDELRNLRDKIINLESALDTIVSALMDDQINRLNKVIEPLYGITYE
jgi:hypothetical protein